MASLRDLFHRHIAGTEQPPNRVPRRRQLGQIQRLNSGNVVVRVIRSEQKTISSPRSGIANKGGEWQSLSSVARSQKPKKRRVAVSDCPTLRLTGVPKSLW